MTKQVIVNALEEIRLKDGKKKLHPAAVIKAAADPASPLHRAFVWDDTKAAHQYRLIQARQLIADVEVLHNGRAGPLYVSVTADRQAGGGYRTLPEVVGNEFLKADMLATALAELTAMRQRYELLAELSGVFVAVDELARKHRKAAK